MTPIYKINLHGSNVWAKLENENPTGTHKDRSFKPWIDYYIKQGVQEFALSSSGNSAVSAAKYCAEKSIKLHVFVRPDIEKVKLLKLRRNPCVTLRLSKTPKRDAIRFAGAKSIPNLRASTDDPALIGYEEIARELYRQLATIDNIFVPTSSGATLVGMYNGYAKSKKMPAFYAVQTTKVHPIASYFDQDFVKENTSYATAIVDNIARRRDRVIKIIQETGGGGFVVSNGELEEAKKVLQKKIGWQSVLAFAGFLKWQKQNPVMAANKISVCLFTD